MLYVVLASVPYEGYSPVSQNVSELLAVGAVPLLEANLPAPWMGLKERINNLRLHAVDCGAGHLALAPRHHTGNQMSALSGLHALLRCY